MGVPTLTQNFSPTFLVFLKPIAIHNIIWHFHKFAEFYLGDPLGEMENLFGKS